MKNEINSIVEVTDTHVKFLEVKSIKGKRVLAAGTAKRINHFTDEEIARAIKDLIRSHHIRSDELLLVIPRHLVILRHMRLPSHQGEEIKKMVELHLVSQIPYALEDVVFDYLILDKDPGGYTQVLVIVVHKDVSGRYIKIFQQAGLMLNRLTLSSLGILGWLTYQENEKSLEIKRPIAVMDIDQTRIEICFCDQGKLIFSRSLLYGAVDLSADHLAEIVHQMELTLRAYRNESMGGEISRIIIVSPMKESLALKEQLEKALKISVNVMGPFDHVMCQKNIDLAALKSEPGVSFTVGLGLLCSDIKKVINLTPQEIHQVTASRVKKRQMIATGALVCCVAVLCLAGFGIQLYQKNKFVEELETRLKQIDPELKQAKNQISTMTFFTESSSRQLLVADVIRELSLLTPTEISFRSISLNKNGQLVIEGYGQTKVSVQNFRTQLVASPLFKESVLQSLTERKIFNMDVTEFKITSRMTEEPSKAGHD